MYLYNSLTHKKELFLKGLDGAFHFPLHQKPLCIWVRENCQSHQKQDNKHSSLQSLTHDAVSYTPISR